jgi:alkylation response protein AidB-like acyl-CoA dehydrogenase
MASVVERSAFRSAANEPSGERDDWTERVRALAPQIAAWRDTAEQERRLPKPLVEALREAGLFSLGVRRRVGGAEVDRETLWAVIEELSYLDGAVGWNVMIAAFAAALVSYLPDAALQQVYQEGPNTVVAGAVIPKGVARPAPGGFRLSGRWPFGSGCQQAAWMGGGAVVLADQKPRPRPDGRPDIRIFVLPASDCEILDTWQTTGLRGTGSHDWQVSDLFVPEEYTIPILFDGSREPRALYAGDFLSPTTPGVALVALGIARDALDAFTALAGSKTPAMGSTPLSGQHTVHERVGRAAALLGAGTAYLYDAARRLPSSTDFSAPIEEEHVAHVRLACAFAAQSAAEAVDLLVAAAGTTSLYTSSRLERCFRDVHTAVRHAAIAPSNVEMVGQYLLGLGLQTRR